MYPNQDRRDQASTNARKSLRDLPPLVDDAAQPLTDERVLMYRRRLGEAGVPFRRVDLECYLQLLAKHNSLGLASNPDIYEKESIGVAALADLHRAADARRSTAMDDETLAVETADRAKARASALTPPTALACPSTPNRRLPRAPKSAAGASTTSTYRRRRTYRFRATRTASSGCRRGASSNVRMPSSQPRPHDPTGQKIEWQSPTARPPARRRPNR